MTHTKHKAPPEAGVPAWMDEPDIGSGEKTPGEHETDAIVRGVAPGKPAAPQPAAPARPDAAPAGGRTPS